MEVKKCSKCFLIKNINSFHKNLGRYRGDCKECVKSYSIEYREKNKNLIRIKKRKYQQEKPEIKYNSYLKKTYNISLEEYKNILKLQDSKCAICRSEYVGNKQHKNLHLDHCHKTGKIRGILCGKCNAGLGHFKDDISLLLNAVDYLKKVLTIAD